MKKVICATVIVIISACAAFFVWNSKPYEPTSFVVDGINFSAQVENGGTMILELANSSDSDTWTIIEKPECFASDYNTAGAAYTEFHIIALDDGTDTMVFRHESGDGISEAYKLTLEISRHKKTCLQIDSVSFIRDM